MAEQQLTDGADEVYVNGDSFIREAKALEPVFKRRMFAERGRIMSNVNSPTGSMIIEEIDRLKRELDKLRPLPSDVVGE